MVTNLIDKSRTEGENRQAVIEHLQKEIFLIVSFRYERFFNKMVEDGLINRSIDPMMSSVYPPPFVYSLLDPDEIPTDIMNITYQRLSHKGELLPLMIYPISGYGF